MGTGFGKNMKNILLELFYDKDIEVVEAANGVQVGGDVRTPWKSYGTHPTDLSTLRMLQENPHRNQAASYGYYTIDAIIDSVKPDVYVGIEDVWAFRDFEKKKWWGDTPTIIWTTLDSLPLLPDTKNTYDNCDKLLVWASFAEKELSRLGMCDSETLHGAVDYSNFRPLENRLEIKRKFNIHDNFVIGFVFKNQLRKSVPNLLEGFRIFKETYPTTNAKLLLHTDWSEKDKGWDINRLISEKNIEPSDVLATYVCHTCGEYYIDAYKGENHPCESCGGEGCVHTKTSAVGVSEEKLNEIYNCMDVYCHPFTSGGQELPIQEAKAAGLITLVTEYSCGTDSCYEHQGGIPLKWSEYREPNTQFIKATTCPQDISDKLWLVRSMTDSERESLARKGLEYVRENFCIKKIAQKLKKIIIEAHAGFSPQETPQENEPEKLSVFEDFLGDEGKSGRIAVVIPQSAQDVFLINHLLENIKKTYPDKNLYFITNPKYFELVEDHPAIHKLIPYQSNLDNAFLLEGRADHEGYFEIAFMPHATTQKFISYLHNGNDKSQLDLFEA